MSEIQSHLEQKKELIQKEKILFAQELISTLQADPENKINEAIQTVSKKLEITHTTCMQYVSEMLSNALSLYEVQQGAIELELSTEETELEDQKDDSETLTEEDNKKEEITEDKEEKKFPFNFRKMNERSSQIRSYGGGWHEPWRCNGFD